MTIRLLALAVVLSACLYELDRALRDAHGSRSEAQRRARAGADRLPPGAPRAAVKPLIDRCACRIRPVDLNSPWDSAHGHRGIHVPSRSPSLVEADCSAPGS